MSNVYLVSSSSLLVVSGVGMEEFAVSSLQDMDVSDGVRRLRISPSGALVDAGAFCAVPKGGLVGWW